jgi:hypothetical protein
VEVKDRCTSGRGRTNGNDEEKEKETRRRRRRRGEGEGDEEKEKETRRRRRRRVEPLVTLARALFTNRRGPRERSAKSSLITRSIALARKTYLPSLWRVPSEG